MDVVLGSTFAGSVRFFKMRDISSNHFVEWEVNSWAHVMCIMLFARKRYVSISKICKSVNFKGSPCIIGKIGSDKQVE